MTNTEIALILKEIAGFLQLKEENPYRVRAYSKGAQIIEKHPEDIVRLVHENRLNDVKGIGDKLSAQVEEIIRTGRCLLLEELKDEFSPILKNILLIPGVGAKTARIIFDNLKIKSLSDLREACENGTIRNLPSLGIKTEKSILEGIKKLERKDQKYLLGLCLPFSDTLLNNFKELEGVDQVELAGSIRRKKETVNDIDIIVVTSKREEVKNKIIDSSLIRQVLNDEGYKISFLNIIGLRVDVFFFSRECFPLAWLYLTGSQEHIENLEKKANQKELELTFNTLFDKTNYNSEEEVYSKIGLQYIPPELREGGEEIEMAQEGELPNLIKQSDLKGDLHIHTDWSDGANSLEDMVISAENKGYEYIAITDHSRSLVIAGGLSENKLRKQVERIKELNEKQTNGFRILSGVEVDILNDGNLDYPDNVLKELDFVVASVHQGFGQNTEHITKRVLNAMENHYVRAIGHPLGRLINKREAHELDLEKIFEKAGETGTLLEINSSLDRLDLPSYYVKKAKEYGIKFVINTDAHDIKRLDEIKYGIFTGRKGFLDKDKVINTLCLDELLKWL